MAQRALAMIVNLGCDIAQQGVATVEDINIAVKLGLGYPYGPIEWGDVLGTEKILKILDRMTAITRDQRY
ncbi:3-hydroxyacyl-CoA dehydrogenase family protein, partial [Klebsiella pneumoniae]|nr:3-hydroxyacyl-CoA dehydrogenase family protein [Klebsiella pneumoniae]